MHCTLITALDKLPLIFKSGIRYFQTYFEIYVNEMNEIVIYSTVLQNFCTIYHVLFK